MPCYVTHTRVANRKLKVKSYITDTSNYKHVMLENYGEMYILSDIFQGLQFFLAAQSLCFQVSFH